MKRAKRKALLALLRRRTFVHEQLKGRKPSNKSKVYYLLGGGSLK